MHEVAFESDWVTRFGRLCVKYGVHRLSAICAILCTFVSVVITWSSMVYFDIPRIDYGLIVSTIIPILISYPSFFLVWNLILRLHLAEREMANIANHDPLTQLPNRRCFDQFVGVLLERCRDSEQGGAVFIVDIDHFKQYNDYYGHQQGDVCLQAIARKLEKEIEGLPGMVARFGGEEFVVVLESISATDMQSIGNRLCRAVADEQIPHQASVLTEWVTVSVGGGYSHDMHETQCIDGLISIADKNLYQAKSQGRNTFVG